jgi:hypothetical protein
MANFLKVTIMYLKPSEGLPEFISIKQVIYCDIYKLWEIFFVSEYEKQRLQSRNLISWLLQVGIPYRRIRPYQCCELYQCLFSRAGGFIVRKLLIHERFMKVI